LSSALSDQLRIERESMMTELYTMLEDGVISADEQELIEAEAKRLHLSQGELARLLEKAKVEMGVDHTHEKDAKDSKPGKANSGEMSLEFLSKHPELAAEQLKITISKLQQIMSVSDHQELRKYIDNPDNVTALQSSMLQFLLQHDGGKPKNKG
jgi:hypothetical protein